MSKTTYTALALALVFSAPAAANAEDKPAPVMPAKASQCLSCHGADGKPELADVPIIAGQQPVYLQNALDDYKSGARSGGQALVMQEMVKDLSADDIKTLATWFGAQQ